MRPISRLAMRSFRRNALQMVDRCSSPYGRLGGNVFRIGFFVAHLDHTAAKYWGGRSGSVDVGLLGNKQRRSERMFRLLRLALQKHGKDHCRIAGRNAVQVEAEMNEDSSEQQRFFHITIAHVPDLPPERENEGHPAQVCTDHEQRAESIQRSVDPRDPAAGDSCQRHQLRSEVVKASTTYVMTTSYRSLTCWRRGAVQARISATDAFGRAEAATFSCSDSAIWASHVLRHASERTMSKVW